MRRLHLDDEDSDSCHFFWKIAVVGDTGVGKTTLVDTEANGGSSRSLPSSASDSSTSSSSSLTSLRSSGEGVYVRSVLYEESGFAHKVSLWVVPGSHRYFQLSSRFAAGAAAAIFVFDLTNRRSFESVEDWVAELERTSSSTSSIPVRVLVGNKADQAQSAVSRAEALTLSRKLGMEYLEASALEGSGVSAVLETIVEQVAASIPAPADPSALVKKGVKIGSKLLGSASYRKSLFKN